MALRTSGSTARPRTVVRTTESWVASFPAVESLAGLTVASSVWVPGPLTASMNLFAAVHTEHLGATRVGRPEQATHAVLTPAQLSRALPDLAAGTVAVVAGDRLPPALHARARERGLRVHHYYGAAELSFVAWGPHGDELRGFPGVEVEVRDGEIWVRSPYLCCRYDGAPGPMRRDENGFATVGDRGRLTDGRLVLDGRPEAVTTAGATVLVSDVERVLREAARGEVAVLGVPHTEFGEVVAAVVTDPGDRELLPRVARAALDPAARPRLWVHVSRLPLNPAGKVDREALRGLVTRPDGPRRPA